MTPIFEVQALTVGYHRPIVSNISFSVNRGELVGILGRNGHGKTTLLRGITGDAKRFFGGIRINGQDCTNISTKKRAAFLSLLPQKSYIPQGITVQEILEMGCYPNHGIFQTISAKDREKISLAAERLNLVPLLKQDCSKLSMGQQQMVLLCRMMVQDTPVMLLDEPNAALDYYNTQILFQTLRALVQEGNKAGVLVLHDPEMALHWCDRLLILHEGKLIQDLHIAQSEEQQIQTALQQLYPKIQVRKSPFHQGYFCYLQEE